MAVGGFGMLLKSMGIDPEQMQMQMAAFGAGVKEFSDRLLVMQQQLYVLEGKVDALHMALDERLPVVDGYAPFPGASDPAPMSRLIMDDRAIEATKQHAS